MMTNLFSIFDPSSSVGLGGNWGALALSCLLLLGVKWVQGARWGAFALVVGQSLSQELLVLLPSKLGAGVVVFVSLFIFIGVSNGFGLLPYVFTSTSHLVVSLSLALPLWGGGFLRGWATVPQKALAHLVPMGSPSGLMPFMVVVEGVSTLIRPGTLAVRLSANMIAGHLLLTLMSSAVSPYSGYVGVGVLSGQSVLVLLEAAVAVIQAYVFIILSALYISEA